MYKKNISAEPGQPSTFWSKDGENWYRTKAEAEQNDVSKAVNPDDYAIEKSFWQSNKKWIIAVLILVIAGVGVYGYKKGWFNKILKH